MCPAMCRNVIGGGFTQWSNDFYMCCNPQWILSWLLQYAYLYWPYFTVSHTTHFVDVRMCPPSCPRSHCISETTPKVIKPSKSNPKHIFFYILSYICVHFSCLQKTRGTLRSSAGLLCGSWRRRTATCALRRSGSMRRRFCASSTPNGVGVSGGTRPPLRTSPKRFLHWSLHTDLGRPTQDH